MKKTVFCWLLLAFASCSDGDASDDNAQEATTPQTRIPDANFEAALVDLGLDDVVDGMVSTSAIDFVQDLNLDGKDIASLTGIADFRALVNLSVRDNRLTALDVSDNPDLLFVWAENNALSRVTIGPNADFEKLGLSGNQMTTLEVSAYPKLQLLTLADNLVTAIDVSANPELNTLAVEGNPLTCIQVSQAQLENPPANWTRDAEDGYSLSCD